MMAVMLGSESRGYLFATVAAISLLGRLRSVESKREERSSILYRYKRRKTPELYTEKRPYSAKPSSTTGARSRPPVPGLGHLLCMGAGEAHGGYQPPGQI
jgi:hypothetical protein